MKPFDHPSVAKVFEEYPEQIQRKLLKLRELIFNSANEKPEVGEIEETLKWGQPSYLTNETKSGSTIRIDAIPSSPGSYAMYFHCQTTLIEDFRNKHGSTFEYEGNRALIFNESEEIPEKELVHCILLAQTYHLKDKKIRTPIGSQINKQFP